VRDLCALGLTYSRVVNALDRVHNVIIASHMPTSDARSKGAPAKVPARDRYRAGTLDKGLDVLEVLETGSKALTIQEVAEATGVQRAAVFRLLCTLERRGYVERLDNKKYRSTMRHRRVQIGYCGPLAGNPFRHDLAASLRAAAEAANVDLLVLDNDENDAEGSLRNLQALVDAKVDLAMLFQPVEWIGHTMADRLVQAGIPFLTIEVPLQGGVYFGANNFQAGRLAGQVLADFALEHWKGRFDSVVLVESSLVSTNVPARLAGVLVGLKDKLANVDSSRVIHLDGRAHLDASREVVAQFLSRRARERQRLLIGCFNDQAAIGALEAVRAAGRERDVAIVGQNATEESWEEIRNPNSRFIASVAYFPERYGTKLVHLAQAILNREPVPPATYTDHLVLTGANIERFYRRKQT
jgi:ribose transport system substrate-binding protein